MTDSAHISMLKRKVIFWRCMVVLAQIFGVAVIGGFYALMAWALVTHCGGYCG